MRRFRSKKVSLNTKLILDVVGASLIVDLVPQLLTKVVTVDEKIGTLAGIGSGYLAGMFLKRPDLANASIGVGAVSFLLPVLSNLIGTSTSLPSGSTGGTKALPPMPIGAGVQDYISLNDYVAGWKSQSKEVYKDSY
jgi:hypothetical protein